MSIEKTSRNKRIFALSRAGGGTMSYRELATEYNISSVKTIYRIVNREASRGKKKKGR